MTKFSLYPFFLFLLNLILFYLGEGIAEAEGGCEGTGDSWNQDDDVKDTTNK